MMIEFEGVYFVFGIWKCVFFVCHLEVCIWYLECVFLCGRAKRVGGGSD